MNAKMILALASLGLLNFDAHAGKAESLEAIRPGARTAPAFPLKLSGDRRFLVDQNERPFLVVGDSPWSLMVEPAPAQVDLYLDDRAARGFSLILVNLLEHKFSSQPPKLHDGTAPFAVSGDLSTPNENYFRYAEEVVAKAARRGIVVLLCPAYLGYDGGDEGFFQELSRGGPEKARAYGRYVGQRFRDHANLIWVVGGDFTPPLEKRWTVEEVAAGIRDEDTVHLMTVHCGPGDSAATVYGGRPWFQLNNVYHYREDLYAPCLEQDARGPRWPYFQIETAYEGEHKATPDRIRRQAYWPLLTGAFGIVYGNSPLWHFASRGVFDRGGDWVAALNSRGAQDIGHLAEVFRERAWWRLRPDRDHKLMTAGYGTVGKLDYVVAASTGDGTLALAYLPASGATDRELTVDLSRLAGTVTANWFSPTDGRLTPVAGSPLANAGLLKLQCPGDNGSGANDWLLILETATGFRSDK